MTYYYGKDSKDEWRWQLKADNGKEYRNRAVERFCRETGIAIDFCCVEVCAVAAISCCPLDIRQ